MKKIFSMVALAFTTLTMSAQEDSKFSAYVGVGLSNVVGSDANNTKSSFSYKIGVNYDANISESFSIIPGVEFANNAFKINGIDGDINRFYIQIPILAAYKFNISDNTKLAIKAGPYVGYGLFGSDIEWYGGSKSNIFDENENKRFDLGIRAGVSVDFSQFTLGIEFNRGLTKVFDEISTFNQNFGVTLGYKF